MICTTKQQAERIANYGADKMDDQGYTYQHTVAGLYLVTKPGQVPYVVDSNPSMVALSGGRFCDCGFAKENQTFGVCKHNVWIERKIDEESILQKEAELADWENYGKYDQMAGKF